MTRVYISPTFNGPDRGDGGIRRVVEAQNKWLPTFGIELVDNIKHADVAAFHAGKWEDIPAGLPVVAHTHGLYWAEYEWPSYLSDVNSDVLNTLRCADAITAPSRWVADALARGMWADCEVLYHGIEPDEWHPGTNRGYVLWNKTRIDPVCDPLPVTELALLVPGQRFVSTYARGFSKPDNIELTGNMPYTAQKKLIQDAAVYLATSRETFGIGTLEAMACGVPVLGFDFGGQPEIIVHKEHGYLAAPGDYDDLVRGLEWCLKHRQRVGASARRRVLEHFNWRTRIAPYSDLYRRLHEESRDRPRVSVVITNYNLGEYLPKAVESAKEQRTDGLTVEIVVVDDASTEPVPADILNDPTIKVIRNPKNLYLAGALNVGVEAATGEYIIPLDADNRLAPGALSVLTDALDNDRTLDIAYGKLHLVTPNDADGFVSGWPPAEASNALQVQNRNQISSTALYRKKVWSRVGGYRRRCHTAEDADFWSRALALGFTGRRVTDAVTLVYLDRQDSMSHVQKDWLWSSWYKWSVGRNRAITTGGPIRIHDRPLVSVVIPVGPGHKHLVVDALDSVQAQSNTFADWEAIVVNDTGEPLPWVHPWAKVVGASGGVRQGVSAARNRGIDASRGTHILFLDADDYLHPDALYHLYNTALSSQCPKCFVYTDWFVAETGEARTVRDFNSDEVLHRLPYPVTCLYRKEDLIQGNIRFDESLKNGWEDWDFAIQAVAKSGLCGIHISAPLLHYRLSTGTLRQAAGADRDRLHALITEKWADYVSGEKTNMAGGCGACGGGRYPSIMEAVVNNGVFDGIDLEKDTTILQYNSPPEWTGARSYLGQVTGNRYKFTPEGDMRTQRVYNQDVPGLLSLGFFTTVGTEVGKVQPLQASGPPAKEAA